jgi:hypothetical protein
VLCIMKTRTWFGDEFGDVEQEPISENGNAIWATGVGG